MGWKRRRSCPPPGRNAATRRGGLRLRVLVLVVAAVSPAFVAVGYLGAAAHRQAVRAAEAHTADVAQLAAAHHQEVVESARVLLATLARTPQVHPGASGDCDRFLADLLGGFPQYLSLGAATPDGLIYCSALPRPTPVSVADRAYFRRALASGGFVVGDYQIGRLTGRPTVNFATVARGEGGAAHAVVFAALDLGYLADLAAEATLPRGAVLVVVDAAGTVLARNPDPHGFVGRAFPDDPLVQAIRQSGGGGMATVAGLDRRPRLYAFTTLREAEDSPTVAVGVPPQVAFADAARVRRLALWFVAGGALVVLALAWAALGTVVLRPLHALIRTSRRLGSGDLATRSGLGDAAGEVGELARSFDAMAAALEARHGELRDQAQLLDLADDIIVVRDLEGRIRYWNQGAERHYGWPAGEAVGRIAHDLLATGFPLPLEVITGHLHREGHWDGELVQQRRDGTRIVVASRWTLRTDETDSPVAVLDISRDITERKRAEERFRSLLESAPDAMVIVGPDGGIILANRQAEALFGHSRDDLVGHPVEMLLPERSRSRHRRHRTDFAASPEARVMGAGRELLALRGRRPRIPRRGEPESPAHRRGCRVGSHP